MPVTDELINQILYGTSSDLSDEVQDKIELHMKEAAKRFESVRANRSSNALMNRDKTRTSSLTDKDGDFYTTIQNMVNSDNKMMTQFGAILDTLYEKNKKYFSLIKDYETMPIMIPQINRVLMFMVNECISPDVQNEYNFVLQCESTENQEELQSELDDIRREHGLDNLLRDVYENRYKLGREYYRVIDYGKSFARMRDVLEKRSLNESYTGIHNISEGAYIDRITNSMCTRIDEFAVTIPTLATGKSKENTTETFSTDSLNIVIERSSLVRDLMQAKDTVLTEAYSYHSPESMLEAAINEDYDFNQFDKPIDRDKLDMIIQNLQRKKLRRCSVERLDPARVFRLKLGGKIIGYFYLTDLEEEGNSRNLINFAQSLKDRLLKSKSMNIDSANVEAEETICKTLATKIINAFDPNIGISRIEDIDLLHDFIINTELYLGNKKLTFYYADEIFDFSRANDSVLTNAVFYVKLYTMLMMNNLQTKVLRGKGRQIHTVNMGISPNVRRYLEYAMKALVAPETNLGTLNGTFEQLLNPLYSSPDIVIPTDGEERPFIQTDYIEGQNVDMDNDFLRYLLNSVITTFGLDSAVLDATNGNLNFASTLAMESTQISNMIRCEQTELLPEWMKMVIKICYICGSDNLRQAIDNDSVMVEFFSPKSLILKTSTDEINNAKSFADTMADNMPELNTDGENVDKLRTRFVYNIIRDRANIDWAFIDKTMETAKLESQEDALDAQAATLSQAAINNTEEKDYDAITPEDLQDDDDLEGGGMPPFEDIEGMSEMPTSENPEGEPATPEAAPEQPGQAPQATQQETPQAEEGDMSNISPTNTGDLGVPDINF